MSRKVVLADVKVALPTDEMLRAEIVRQVRFRSPGFWLATLFALFFFGLMPFTFPMMHYQENTTTVDATIVEVGRDPDNGEILMTSEFSDADGVVHSSTETSGYHYAWGEPEVGQHLKYIYWRNKLSGDFESTPRADGMLKWFFGITGAVLALLAIGVGVYVNRHRRLRLRLIVSGRRERGARYAIEAKTTAITLKTTIIIEQWRLNARYFEDSLTAFKDCHSDWQPGLPPDRLDNLTVPMILVDAINPRRYWLPVGELHDRRPVAT